MEDPYYCISYKHTMGESETTQLKIREKRKNVRDQRQKMRLNISVDFSMKQKLFSVE